MATAGEIEIAISEPIIAEVVRILGDKFEWPLERLAQAERTMRKIGLMVTPTQKLNVVRSDADDNAIVECAVASGSEAIVTGDKDLLRRKEYAGIKMVTVRDFLQRGKEK
jgi:putative PIN family toxin of toxin-antitoxin system